MGRGWLRAGQVLAVVSVVLCIAMQAVARQWFPPPVSMSQYGVGPWGWIFSLWAVSFSLSPVCCERSLPGRNLVSRVQLLLGLAGTVVMAIVRTDPGGAQISINAKVHLVASIFCLAFLPLGMLATLWGLGRRWRWTGMVLVGIVAASLGLLILAAVGYDSAGMGSHRSWAFWQSVATVGCLTMVGSLALAANRTFGPLMSDHTSRPAPSVSWRS